MAVAGANFNDELLPELEMSIIPSKLTDNVKLDLFGFSDEFLNFLAVRGYIDNSANNDTQYMTMTRAIGFCKIVRNLYRTFNAQVASADV